MEIRLFSLPKRCALAAALLVLTLNLRSVAEDKPAISSAPQPSAWTPSLSLAVKETFDNNVFLRSIGPNAYHQSLITTILPGMGIGWKPSGLFNASLSYAPEINVFHSAASEDFTLHRVGLSLAGKADHSSWEVTENFIGIDGNNVGPTYTEAGGAPAGGGPAIRDRRDALIERGQARFTQTIGRWFVRPVVNGYLHDFRTVKKTTAGYQNFAERNDLNGGADVGWALTEGTCLVGGYRYGVQNQAQVFPSINATHYDSRYHRVLVGVEGKPWNWLKVNLSLGPEFRHYDGIVAAGFNRYQLYPYVDSSATVTPTKADTIILSVKSLEQPGFAGRSTYIDSTYEGSWRHKVTDQLTLGVVGRGYNTDFIKPSATRNDWILTGSVLASYAFNQQLSAEISYSYDDAVSRVENTPGREYTRHYIALGMKYAFR